MMMTLDEAISKLDALDENEKTELKNAGFAEEVEVFDLVDHFIYKGESATVHKLIESGVDINMQNHYGWSFLHMAIRHNKMDLVEYFIDKGININITDGVGWTPLMEGIMDDRAAMVKLLLDHKADRSVRNQRGASASDLVMKFQRQDMFAFFQ